MSGISLPQRLRVQAIGNIQPDHMLMQFAADKIEALEGALSVFVDEYTEMVNSGDCGFWDPEQEAKVIAARAALSTPSQPQKGEK